MFFKKDYILYYKSILIKLKLNIILLIKFIFKIINQEHYI